MLALEHLPYALFASCQAVLWFSRFQLQAVEAKVKVEKPGSTVQLQPEDRIRLGVCVDLFLDSARRAQNAVIPYLSLKFPTLGPQLPKSLAVLVKNLEAEKLTLESSLADCICSYWHSYGSRLKSYRDLGQHWAIVPGDARVVIPQEGQPGLVLLLPNNPEVQNRSRLEYGKPGIHAFQFLQENFLALTAFSRELVEMLLDEEDLTEMFSVLGSRPTVVGGEIHYLIPPPHEDFCRELARALEGIGAKAEPTQTGGT